MGEPIGVSDAGAIIGAVKEMVHQPQLMNIIGPEGKAIEVIVVPDGTGKFKLQSTKPFVDEARKTPEMRVGTATMSRLPSFCEHVNRFKTESTVIFADV